jgi:RNA polymerase sigma-70 factor (ECF subfamily)
MTNCAVVSDGRNRRSTELNESSPLLVSQNSPGPEDHQQNVELVQAIQRCLEELTDEQRTAAVLCDVEGYDYSEIADIMSTSLGTVKSRLSRARAKLRDCLQGTAELLPKIKITYKKKCLFNNY